MQLFEEAGTDLAQTLTAKEAIERKKAAMCPDVAKALARVSGGLYIGKAGAECCCSRCQQPLHFIRAAVATGPEQAYLPAGSPVDPELSATSLQ